MSLEFVYFDIQALGLMPRLVLKVLITVIHLFLHFRQIILISSIPESTLKNGELANLFPKNLVKLIKISNN